MLGHRDHPLGLDRLGLCDRHRSGEKGVFAEVLEVAPENRDPGHVHAGRFEHVQSKIVGLGADHVAEFAGDSGVEGRCESNGRRKSGRLGGRRVGEGRKSHDRWIDAIVLANTDRAVRNAQRGNSELCDSTHMARAFALRQARETISGWLPTSCCSFCASVIAFTSSAARSSGASAAFIHGNGCASAAECVRALAASAANPKASNLGNRVPADFAEAPDCGDARPTDER
jgi:hypothetical protein